MQSPSYYINTDPSQESLRFPAAESVRTWLSYLPEKIRIQALLNRAEEMGEVDNPSSAVAVFLDAGVWANSVKETIDLVQAAYRLYGRSHLMEAICDRMEGNPLYQVRHYTNLAEAVGQLVSQGVFTWRDPEGLSMRTAIIKRGFGLEAYMNAPDLTSDDLFTLWTASQSAAVTIFRLPHHQKADDHFWQLAAAAGPFPRVRGLIGTSSARARRIPSIRNAILKDPLDIALALEGIIETAKTEAPMSDESIAFAIEGMYRLSLEKPAWGIKLQQATESLSEHRRLNDEVLAWLLASDSGPVRQWTQMNIAGLAALSSANPALSDSTAAVSILKQPKAQV